jgi:uncharacterized protein GlcG (DUF336 family)
MEVARFSERFVRDAPDAIIYADVVRAGQTDDAALRTTSNCRIWAQTGHSRMKSLLLAAICAAILASQAHAQGLLQTHRISADLANQAVAAVVAKCASQGYAETGALVDADGVQLAVLRGDRAGAHTLDSAYAKAYTAASFKTDTTALVERSKTVPVLANLFELPHLLLLGGGIVIKLGDEVVGAIGAAGAPGGDLDDACAHAGLDKIKDQLK